MYLLIFIFNELRYFLILVQIPSSSSPLFPSLVQSNNDEYTWSSVRQPDRQWWGHEYWSVACSGLIYWQQGASLFAKPSLIQRTHVVCKDLDCWSGLEQETRSFAAPSRRLYFPLFFPCSRLHRERDLLTAGQGEKRIPQQELIKHHITVKGSQLAIFKHQVWLAIRACLMHRCSWENWPISYKSYILLRFMLATK